MWTGRSHCWMLAAILLATGTALAQGPTHVALLGYRVTNAGEEPITNAVSYCLLPATTRYQEIVDLRIHPEPTESRADNEGQRVVTVPLGPIPAGATRSVRILVWVRLKAVNVPLVRVAEAPALPEEARESFLRDEVPFNLEKVRPTAVRVAGGRARDLDQARAFYDHIAEQCHYDINEELETADEVLAGKPASCSELAYAFVAMCRSVGIPARPVPGCVNRDGIAPSTDWNAHCWAEFYAADIGWIPVDPTNRINRPTEHFFGRQDGKYLALLDDGMRIDEGPDPRWFAHTVYREPASGELKLMRTSTWRVSNERAAEAELFDAACTKLASEDVAVRTEAVREWESGRPPLATGLLLEALLDPAPEIRKSAATALGRNAEPTMLVAIMWIAKDEPDGEVKAALVEAARQALNRGDDEHRADAVKELAKSRTDEALDMLVDVWRDPALPVRKAAANMLYKFGDKPAVHVNYRRLVTDPDDYVRIAAALRWARTGTSEVLPFLVDHLESRVRWDREKSLEVLGERAGDTFGFNPRTRPDSRRNREAIARLREWATAEARKAEARADGGS